MWKAIFWDNDGVLVDTEGLYYQATREVIATVGVSLSEEDVRRPVPAATREVPGTWRKPEACRRAKFPALRRRRDDRFAALIDAGPTAIAGVATVVRRLAERYRMAIVTSSEHFDRIHRDPAFLSLFEFVLTPAHYRYSNPILNLTCSPSSAAGCGRRIVWSSRTRSGACARPRARA